MEKTAQNTSGAPRRRRRRRGSGSGAAQAASTQQETTKTTQQVAPAKSSRGQAPRKEGKESPSNSRNRHRGSQSEPAPQQPASRRNRGGAQAPNREAAHNAKPAQKPARPRHTAEEEPGLELIARRPPKQKFANFEEYLAAHGGMTVPLPEETPAEDGTAALSDGVTE